MAWVPCIVDHPGGWIKTTRKWKKMSEQTALVRTEGKWIIFRSATINFFIALSTAICSLVPAIRLLCEQLYCFSEESEINGKTWEIIKLNLCIFLLIHSYIKKINGVMMDIECRAYELMMNFLSRKKVFFIPHCQWISDFNSRQLHSLSHSLSSHHRKCYPMENLCCDNLCDVVMGLALPLHHHHPMYIHFEARSRDIVSAVKATKMWKKKLFCWLSIFHRQWNIAIKHDQYLFAPRRESETFQLATCYVFFPRRQQKKRKGVLMWWGRRVDVWSSSIKRIERKLPKWKLNRVLEIEKF